MIRLRRVSETDATAIVRWRNRNAAFFPPQPAWTTRTHRKWYRKTYLWDLDLHYYMVCDTWGSPLGTISIRENWNANEAEIGNVLRAYPYEPRPESAICHTGSKGAMSEALQKVMALHRFERYYLRVLPGNDHAIRFYMRNGFCGLPPQPGTDLLTMMRYDDRYEREDP